MDNISGSLKGYEKMADNYKEVEFKNSENNYDEKEFKKTLTQLIKDYQKIEENISKLRNMKPMKELYDANVSLNNFIESIQKVEMIYN